jgi:hypothetical protein
LRLPIEVIDAIQNPLPLLDRAAGFLRPDRVCSPPVPFVTLCGTKFTGLVPANIDSSHVHLRGGKQIAIPFEPGTTEFQNTYGALTKPAGVLNSSPPRMWQGTRR